MKVSVVIPAWNGVRDTLACLRSIYASDFPKSQLEVIVVDNGSTDDTAKKVTHKFKQTTVIKLDENMGYAAGINVGMKLAKANCVLVLNNDVELDLQCIKHLYGRLNTSQKIGLASPKLFYWSNKKVIQKVWGGWDLHTHELVNIGRGEVDVGQYNQAKKVGSGTFCAFMIRRELWNEVGGLEERYLLYYEDHDFYWKVRELGWECWFEPRAKLWHKTSMSMGNNSPNQTYYFTRNRLLFRSKYGLLQPYEHMANIRFAFTSWVRGTIDKEMREKWWAITEGVKDFYVGKFGRR